MTHPNKDILIAFANGEEIEWRYKNGEWPPTWMALSGLAAAALIYPELYPNYSFRIKPKKVMIRHAGHPSGAVVAYTKNYSESEDTYTATVEKNPLIVWLDEWHEASFGPEGSNG